jgi:hypothetical protein
MHTIFERLVEELKAWDLFEDPKEYPSIWDVSGASLADYDKSPRHRRDLQGVPAQDVWR